ncbi:MAG: hypothetical protein F6K19_24085 [Cyanothece sp. SIO1E1]|nr:hypothetical protein [Cyanothece sp. SIO1E1]
MEPITILVSTAIFKALEKGLEKGSEELGGLAIDKIKDLISIIRNKFEAEEIPAILRKLEKDPSELKNRKRFETTLNGEIESDESFRKNLEKITDDLTSDEKSRQTIYDNIVVKGNFKVGNVSVTDSSGNPLSQSVYTNMEVTGDFTANDVDITRT